MVGLVDLGWRIGGVRKIDAGDSQQAGKEAHSNRLVKTETVEGRKQQEGSGRVFCVKPVEKSGASRAYVHGTGR